MAATCDRGRPDSGDRSRNFLVRHQRQQAAKSVTHGPVSVLVGDFANHTGDPVLDNTLEPMLGVALEGASFINAYSRGDARKQAQKLPHPTDKLDEQSARLVAVNQDVNAVITGEINLRGDEYDISAIALDAVSGKVIAKSEVTVANKQDILNSPSQLAAPIRKALGDSTPASVQFAEVSGGFKAASLEAVHQASIGVDEQFAGKFQEAFDSFQKAAALDPKFAWAYTGMAAMAQNLGRPEDAVKYMKLAMQHVDNMTERERYRDRGTVLSRDRRLAELRSGIYAARYSLSRRSRRPEQSFHLLYTVTQRAQGAGSGQTRG